MKDVNGCFFQLAKQSFVFLNVCNSLSLSLGIAADLILGLNGIIYFGGNNYILYFLFQDHPT